MRAARIGVATIPLAPIASSRSIVSATPLRRHRAFTATQSGSLNGATVGDSMPGVRAAARSNAARGMSYSSIS